MYLEKFSKRLKELMELEGFSIRALSLKIKVERRSIQLWLAGKFFPRYDALIKLSIYFGVRIAEQNLTEISYEVYVEDRTLYGYRIKYMDLFVLLAKKYNYTIKIDE